MSLADQLPLALSGTLLGVIMTITFGLMWWVIKRRAIRALDLKLTHGQLQQLSIQRVKGPKNSEYWKVNLLYEYQVMGKSHTSNRLRLSFNSFKTSALAEAAAAPYAVGDRVTVWYDPNQPSWAILDKTAPTKDLAIFGWIAVVSALVAIASALFMAYNWPTLKS